MPATIDSPSVQSSDTFTCPSWCVIEHDRAEAKAAELVIHAGTQMTWWTTKETVMAARLECIEFLDVPPRHARERREHMSPHIWFSGDDGSGFVGFNEMPIADLKLFLPILNQLERQATA